MTNNINFSWSTGGTKQIDVTACNGLGDPVTDSISIEVSSQQEEDFYVFLPLVVRN